MKCTLVLSLAEDVSKLKGDLIGVDKGAYILAANNLPMIVAIGDFDSVSNEEYQTVKSRAEKMLELNPVKNETDTLAALRYAVEAGYDEIEIYGGLGKRLDHTIANILLLISEFKIKSLKNETTMVSVLEEGKHIFEKNYKYVSFFAIENAVISLEGFKYCVSDYQLNKYDTIGISNEIAAPRAVINVSEGRLLAVEVNE